MEVKGPFHAEEVKDFFLSLPELGRRMKKDKSALSEEVGLQGALWVWWPQVAMAWALLLVPEPRVVGHSCHSSVLLETRSCPLGRHMLWRADVTRGYFLCPARVLGFGGEPTLSSTLPPS